MGQEWITAKIVLPPDRNGAEWEPVEVRFVAVPRVGDWIDWGPVSRRVMGIAWGGAQDDGVQMPFIFLEFAPHDEHPRHSPARRLRPDDRKPPKCDGD
jgi:hypothetical protein